MMVGSGSALALDLPFSLVYRCVDSFMPPVWRFTPETAIPMWMGVSNDEVDEAERQTYVRIEQSFLQPSHSPTRSSSPAAPLCILLAHVRIRTRVFVPSYDGDNRGVALHALLVENAAR